jgi:hypothetical protein
MTMMLVLDIHYTFRWKLRAVAPDKYGTQRSRPGESSGQRPDARPPKRQIGENELASRA